MSFQCLVVDTGHTRSKFAHCIFSGDAPLPEVAHELALLGEKPVPWDEIRSWYQDHQPDALCVTGTNLSKAHKLVDNWPADWNAPILLSDKKSLPLTVDVDFPEKVGIDRLLNSIAVNALRSPNQPAIIVDTGTAITIDIVGNEGTFRGGAILPGILLGAKSLHLETTTLPHIDVWELLKNEPPVIGKNTEAAIASGLYWGHLGAVKEIVFRYLESLFQTDGPPLLIVTGGASSILTPYLQNSRREPMLSLQGLAIATKHLHESKATSQNSPETDWAEGL